MSRAAEGLRLDRRALLVGVGIAVLLGLGTIGLLGAAADFDELWQAVRAADHVWLPLCLAGLVAAYAGYILGYREVARMHGGPSLPFGTVTRVVAIGFGANVLGSAAGGLAVDFWALHRAGASVRDAARRVLGFNTLEWALLGTIAAVAALLVLAGRGEGAPLAMTLPWLVGVPLCVGAAAWVSSPRRVGRFTHVSEREPAREGRDARGWLRWARVKARKLLADAIGGVVVARHLLTHPRSHAAGVLGFAVYWAGHLVTLWAALRAFAGTAELTLAALVLAFATGYAASALPLPAGGSGGIEAALTFSLHGVGMPLAPALLGVLVYRFFTFWLPLAPALLLLPTAPRLNRDLAGVRDSRGAA